MRCLHSEAGTLGLFQGCDENFIEVKLRLQHCLAPREEKPSLFSAALFTHLSHQQTSAWRFNLCFRMFWCCICYDYMAFLSRTMQFSIGIVPRLVCWTFDCEMLCWLEFSKSLDCLNCKFPVIVFLECSPVLEEKKNLNWHKTFVALSRTEASWSGLLLRPVVALEDSDEKSALQWVRAFFFKSLINRCCICFCYVFYYVMELIEEASGFSAKEIIYFTFHFTAFPFISCCFPIVWM